MKDKDKTLYKITLYPALIFACFLLLGCKKIPKYDLAPHIEFEGYDIHRNHFNSLGMFYADSVIFKIRFRDGDGDLGMDEAAKKNDPNFHNFEMKSFLKTPSGYVPSIDYNGQFQPMTLTPGRVGPIDGTLYYTQLFEYNNYNPNDTLRLTLVIKDRAKNISNEIELAPLIINQQ
jgi:hypothetical protein